MARRHIFWACLTSHRYESNSRTSYNAMDENVKWYECNIIVILGVKGACGQSLLLKTRSICFQTVAKSIFELRPLLFCRIGPSAVRFVETDTIFFNIYWRLCRTVCVLSIFSQGYISFDSISSEVQWKWTQGLFYGKTFSIALTSFSSRL